MRKRARQITDSIHETVYLSNLESELMATPYFYRLHDIYQSSTVYMTFPSNRTKRYEHSVGTMEIASSLLYSAVSNADKNTRKSFFNCLKTRFHKIVKTLSKNGNNSALFFSRSKDEIENLFNKYSRSEIDNDFVEQIRVALADNCLDDIALNHFQYYPLKIQNTITDEEAVTTRTVENVFLYRCLLQAIRICALFHDIGHPPYSHIIEEVIRNLYDKYYNKTSKCKFQKDNIEEFIECLEPYATKDENTAYKCDMLSSRNAHVSAEIHERVGLRLLQTAIDEVIPDVINKTISNRDNSKEFKITSTLYYLTVAEFAFSILVEKDHFYKSIHKIIDGFVDADRLDYIMRDSLNSGVDWGRIPYKRLINSARLACVKNDYPDSLDKDEDIFVIAFPKKVSDEIDDLLLTRYKIFARINFHHSCMKTTVALQSAVNELAESFLEAKNKNDCINPDISVLWTALGTSIVGGDKNVRIIQWNDSWLISVLHKSLVRIKQDEDRTIKRTDYLEENLEEILLSKKRYYTLIKRGSDSREFINKVFSESGITSKLLDELYYAELEKYKNSGFPDASYMEIMENSKFNGLDSVQRIKQMKSAIETADLKFLCSPIPLLSKSIFEIFTEVLEDFKSNKLIIDYKIHENKGREKVGLPKHKNVYDEIYLFEGDRVFTFNDRVTLKKQIEAIKNNVLWQYIYFIPSTNCDNIDKLANDIISNMVQRVSIELKDRYDELFSRLK